MASISEAILKQVKVIPPLSRTASELLVVLEKADHTIDDVVQIISGDPMLVGQLLKIANCAAFARRSPVDTIGGAVSYLGDKLVVGIALGASAGQLYDAPLKGYEGRGGILWAHSLRTAVAAREIAKYTGGKVNSGVAYTAGLLHDIGKALLSLHLEERGKDIYNMLERDHLDFLEAERRVAGADHCEVGELVARHWNLPESLHQAIMTHHDPGKASEPHRPLCYVIHLADTVAMMAGAGTGMDTLRYGFVSDYESYVQIGREDLDRLLLIVGMDCSRMDKALDEISDGE